MPYYSKEYLKLKLIADHAGAILKVIDAMPDTDTRTSSEATKAAVDLVISIYPDSPFKDVF